MRRVILCLRRCFALSRADWRLLAETLVLVWSIRLGLWCMPFRTLWSLVARVSDPATYAASSARPSIARITRIVTRVSRVVPAATCLTQALAAQVLLARRGYVVQLRIGVCTNADGTLAAHAWIEHQGQVVIGDLADLARFMPLPPLQREY